MYEYNILAYQLRWVRFANKKDQNSVTLAMLKAFNIANWDWKIKCNMKLSLFFIFKIVINFTIFKHWHTKRFKVFLWTWSSRIVPSL